MLMNALKGMPSASSDYLAVTKTASIFIFRQRVINVQFVISVLSLIQRTLVITVFTRVMLDLEIVKIASLTTQINIL